MRAAAMVRPTMYSPKFNLVHDRDLLLEAMRENSFATVFGPLSGVVDDESAAATHLPLVVKDEGEHGLIEGHFAKANPHWRALAGRETLVVFPDHTVMFRQRSIQKSFPFPPGTTLPSMPAARSRLLKTILAKRLSSPISSPPMSPLTSTAGMRLPAGFRRTMLAGIVGFRIPIASIEGKFKLSQNRKPEERRNVHDAHAAGSDDQQSLARWMERLAALET